MKNLLIGQFGQVTVNVSTLSEAVLTPETIVHAAKLVVTLGNGQTVELSVNEVLEADLQSYDVETGLPIYSETDLNL